MMTMMIQDVCFLYPNSFDSQKMNLGWKHWRIFKSEPILKVWRSDRKVISSAFYAVNHLDAHTRPAGQAERRPEADSQRTSTTSMADVVGTSSSLEEVCCQIRRSHAACWRKLDERDLRCGCGVPPARSLDLYLYSAEPAHLFGLHASFFQFRSQSRSLCSLVIHLRNLCYSPPSPPGPPHPHPSQTRIPPPLG